MTDTLEPTKHEKKFIRGIPNLFEMYPQIIDIISCSCLILCMILWMPYNIKQNKLIDYSIAMALFWISDIFVIVGCILTLFSIWKPKKILQLGAIFLLLVGSFLCLIGGAFHSDRWCNDKKVHPFYLGQCITYVVFVYCLFVPLSILYVVLLVLYRSQYTFTNLIFMRNKRILYLMFVGALMIIPVLIILNWYWNVAPWVFRAHWICLILLDLFTWICAFIYGFKKRDDKSISQQNINPKEQSCGFNHPLCIIIIIIIWIITFICTLLFGFVGYGSYDYSTDDLLARYGDYILMVSVDLWLIGELLGEDEGWVNIDFEDVNYSSLQHHEPM